MKNFYDFTKFSSAIVSRFENYGSISKQRKPDKCQASGNDRVAGVPCLSGMLAGSSQTVFPR
jgi:hypothetical protein